MRRKQIYLEDRQEEAIKHEAQRRGVTESELIRECIDKHLVQDEDAKRREAGARLIALIRKRHKEVPHGSTVKFDRESLYER